MRVRHIMNKFGRSAGSSEVTSVKPADLAQENGVQEARATLVSATEVEAPAEASSRPQAEAAEVVLMQPPTSGDLPVKEESIVPEFLPAGGSKKDLIRDSFDTLLHSPNKWYPLNRLFSKERGLLWGVEDFVIDQGIPQVRKEFEKLTGSLNADLIWSLHQPLLALIVFILKGENHIHSKSRPVPELKTDICQILGLGPPSKDDAAAPPKPRPERTVRKPHEEASVKRDASGERKPKAKTEIQTEARHGLKRLVPDKVDLILFNPSYFAHAIGPEGPSRKPGPAELNLFPTLKPGYSFPVETADPSQLGVRLEQLPAKQLKRSNAPGGELDLGEDSVKKLKPVISVDEGVSKAVSPLTLETPTKSSRRQLTPRRATPNGVNLTLTALTPRNECPPIPLGEKAREDTAIAALIWALHSRKEQDAQAIEKMAMWEVNERIGELEVTRHREEAEFQQLRARRQALLGAGAGRERDGGSDVSAARERCLRAIEDLLEVLPSDLGKAALDVFKELEWTVDFEGTLGVLARRQREHWLREWNRKDQMVAEAKSAHLEALCQKNKVRGYLGIQAPDKTGQSAKFSTFQEKLAELQQEMKRNVALLNDTEKGAKQAWLAYRGAA